MQLVFTFHKFIFVFTKCKQYLTEIDHQKKDEDERRGSDEKDDDQDETTYRTQQIHISQKTEVEVTTSASKHIEPECQHVDDGKYNNFVDTS